MPLDQDDFVWVEKGDITGPAVLQEVFEDQVLVAMKGRDDQRQLVHVRNLKKMEPDRALRH